MPSALVTTEIVIGALILIAVVVLGVTFARRRYIARGLPLTLCGLRTTPGARWRLGLIRFGDNALEWHTLGGVSLRPAHLWQRQELLIDAPRPLVGDEAIPLLPGALLVPARELGQPFQLALQGPAYTALRSWQEAAPPGYNVNVA